MFNFKKFFCNCLLFLYEYFSGTSILEEVSIKSTKISELESKVSELDLKIKEKNKEIANLKSDEEYLKEKIIKNSKDFTEEISRLENRIENLSKANSELKKVIKTKSSSITIKD